jgi:DNA polymerase-3 subunit beta
MLSVDRKALLAALETLKTIAPKSGTMPVLSHVQLAAEGGALRLSATDLYRAAWVTIPGDGSGQWARAVDLRTTLDRAKRFRNGHCTLAPDGATVLALTEGPRSFRVPGMDPTDCPPMPSETDAKPLATIGDAALCTALDRVLYAASSDQTRAHLNSVRVEVHPKSIRLVSTDGHRLSLWDVDVDTGLGHSVEFLIALDGAEALRSLAAPKKGRKADPVVLTHDAKTVFARVRGVTLALRKVDAMFPPYAQVIPASSSRTVTCDRALLAEVIAAIGACASERTGGVTLTVKGETLRVHTQDPDTGEATETMPVTVTGPSHIGPEHAGSKRQPIGTGPFSIGVNSMYLKEALAEMTEETVSIAMSGELDPIVIRGKEGGVVVVMPMRI